MNGAAEPMRFHYFPIHGRGLAIRALLRMGTAPFVDEVIPYRQWSARKAEMPWGTLPVLRHGEVTLFDTCAITMVVARQSGHWPQDPIDEAKAIALINAVDDGWTMLANVIATRNPVAVVWRFLRVVYKDLPDLLGRFEASFEGDFLMGDTLMAPDLSLFALVHTAQERGGRFGVDRLLERLPRINAHFKRVGQLPEVIDALNLKKR